MMEKTTLELLIDKTSRTLSFSARVLGAKVKPAFMVGYILCRYADTVADTSALSLEKKLFWIERFPSLVEEQKSEDVFAIEQDLGQCQGCSEEEKMLAKNLPVCLNEYNILTSDNKELVLGIVRKVCEGMLFDLKTFKENALTAVKDARALKSYCACMGGAPGIFWSRLILKESAVSLPERTFINYGESIGNALQIVNILRDQPADIKNNRCYIPEQDLARAGLTPKDLKDKNNYAKLKPVVDEWIGWGRENLGAASAYFNAIPKSNWKARASVAWPMLWSLDSLFLLAQAENLLDAEKKVKIKKINIYLTLLKTPLYLVSNRLFNRAVRKKIKK